MATLEDYEASVLTEINTKNFHPDLTKTSDFLQFVNRVKRSIWDSLPVEHFNTSPRHCVIPLINIRSDMDEDKLIFSLKVMCPPDSATPNNDFAVESTLTPSGLELRYDPILIEFEYDCTKKDISIVIIDDIVSKNSKQFVQFIHDAIQLHVVYADM